MCQCMHVQNHGYANKVDICMYMTYANCGTLLISAQSKQPDLNQES